MKRLGLDYETLSKDHPDLIMLSTCLLGQTGPWAAFAGYGPHGAAICGLHHLTGWPDRPPVGPNGPYTDVIAPHYAISALAAAILERRRSGLGQHLDVSQVEAAIHFIEPLVLDQTVNGRTAPATGLDSLNACPHGVYPTAGTERYVAIAVRDAGAVAGAALRRAAAGVRRAALRRPRGAPRRPRPNRRRPARLDPRLRALRALERLLVEAGVPASSVQRMTDLQTDPQLAARGYFVTLNHGEVGPMPYDGLVTRFSAKQTMLHKAAPCLGEDTGVRHARDPRPLAGRNRRLRGGGRVRMSDDAFASLVDDLRAERLVIENALDGLPDDAWDVPSAAEGWTLRDCVAHLAETDDNATRGISPDRAPAASVASARAC